MKQFSSKIEHIHVSESGGRHGRDDLYGGTERCLDRILRDYSLTTLSIPLIYTII